MRLYSTASGGLEELTTSKPGQVGIYVCGATVYDYSHLGHARTFLVFDVLKRFLEQVGYKVFLVQNFTDLEDKIIARAKREGVSASAIAERFTKQYFLDFDRLNVKRADLYPKATEHIPEMIKIIKGLMERGFAYVTKTGVYYDVSKFQRYGHISRQEISRLDAGARVEPDPTKKNPLDFALWKFSDEEPCWESPWGKGRPGWHIECSAMALKYLGEVDIHGGGEDLIFPHHENEAAQSEAYTGRRFARIWMHVGWVEIGGEKMSKSLGNIIPVNEALQRWNPNTIRIFALMTHYKKKQEYSEEALQRAKNIWKNIEDSSWELFTAPDKGSEASTHAVAEVKREFDEFITALSQDFNTPLAIQAMLRVARSIRRWSLEGLLNLATAQAISDHWQAMLSVLGLELPKVSEEERKSVEALIEQRALLRAHGNFGEADKIRDQLRQIGIELVDYPDRTVWKKVLP